MQGVLACHLSACGVFRGISPFPASVSRAPSRAPMVTVSRKDSQAPPFIVSCVVSCMLKASILPAECLSYGVSSDQISVFRASILPAASFSPLADISSTASRPIKQVSIVRPFVCSRAFPNYIVERAASHDLHGGVSCAASRAFSAGL